MTLGLMEHADRLIFRTSRDDRPVASTVYLYKRWASMFINIPIFFTLWGWCFIGILTQFGYPFLGVMPGLDG